MGYLDDIVRQQVAPVLGLPATTATPSASTYMVSGAPTQTPAQMTPGAMPQPWPIAPRQSGGFYLGNTFIPFWGLALAGLALLLILRKR